MKEIMNENSFQYIIDLLVGTPLPHNSDSLETPTWDIWQCIKNSYKVKKKK